MADEYAILVEGLDHLNDLDSLNADINKWAMQATNRTAERFRTVSQRQMQEEIAFSAAYLRSRLTVSRKATQASLEAVISGRDRPTSLARFVTRGKVGRGQSGVDLTVKPGKGQHLAGAFLINLRNGNRGLAVRLAPGKTLANSRRAKKLANNLYLLYGPSVDQVFKGVAEEIGPDALAFLEREFIRLQAANV